MFVMHNPIMWVDPTGLLAEVALRQAVESAGGSVAWCSRTRTASATLNGHTARFVPGSPGVVNRNGTIFVSSSVFNNFRSAATPATPRSGSVRGLDHQTATPAPPPPPQNNTMSAAAVTAGAVAIIDGPSPVGFVAAGMILVGAGIYYVLADSDISLTSRIERDTAGGRANPRDLERGMSNNQKGHFQRLIEEEKRINGMRPNDNLPWADLVAIAEYVRQNFR